MQPTTSKSAGIALTLGTVGYLFFLVYGSLLPFELRPRSFSDALEAFSNIGYLDLGAGSRADWVANILLYIPAAYLLSELLCRWTKTRGFRMVLVSVVVAVLCLSLAVTVEFVQLFFAPRTVSINDLVAETIGIVIGIAIWHGTHARLPYITGTLTAGGELAVRLMLFGYLGAYVLTVLFPYDFVVSGAELMDRLGADSTAWLVGASTCNGAVRCLLTTIVEVVVIAPFGVLLARLGYGWRKALAFGLILGLVLELLQLLLVSGVTQGLTVFTRGGGALAGWWLHEHRLALLAELVKRRRMVRVIIVASGIVYFPVALWLTGGGYANPASMQDALAELQGLNFLPFYYHYFSTETGAVASTLRNIALYVPVALAAWLWQWAGSEAIRQGKVVPRAILWAVVAAFVVETAKLFSPRTHPDPTNLLLAVLTAAVTALVLNWLTAMASGRRAARAGSGETVPGAAPGLTPGHSGMRDEAATSKGLAAKGAALLMLAAVAWMVWDFPVARWSLAAGLAAYWFVLRQWPQAWLAVLLVLLVAVDLSPLSGRLFFDEVDFFILVTLAFRLWHGPLARVEGAVFPLAWRWLLVLLVFSLALATMRGLWPPDPWDVNAYSTYWTGYTALRAVKGVAWALLLLPLVRELAGALQAGRRVFHAGMVGGVAAVSLITAWQRAIFPGLWNFTENFRVTGPFATMHTGGSHLEAYLAFALPVVLAWSLTRRHVGTAALGLGVTAMGSYALMVTFARGGYAAAALGVAVMLSLLFLSTGFGARRRRAVLALGVLGLVGIGVYVVKPILGGPFAQARWATIGQDFDTRLDHWREAVWMMEGGLSNTLLGEGLGQFPRVYLFRNLGDALPATYRFIEKDGERFLRLGAGQNLYFEQVVDIEPYTPYVLSFRAKSTAPEASLSLPVCEKAMLYSYQCSGQTVSIGNTSGQWKEYSTAFDSGGMGSGPWYSARPVKLSIFTGQRGAVVDVDDISLQGPEGREAVTNGGFDRWGDHWHFTTDNYWPYNIEQLWVDAYFAQGLLGLVVISLLGGYLLFFFARVALRGDWLGAGLTGAFVGFGVVGMFGSPFDSPRLSMLVPLVAAAGLALTTRTGRARGACRGAYPQG